MAKIKFENGTIVNFNGNPTPQDIEEVANKLFPQQEQKGFLGRAFDNLKERGQDIKETFSKTAKGEITPLETGVRTVGDVAGSVGDVIGAAISPQVEKLAQKEWAKPAFEALGKGMDKYEEWKNGDELNKRTAEVLESVVNIADLAGATSLAKTTGKSVIKAGKKTVNEIADTAKYVKTSLPELGQKASKLLASEPNEKIKTILKETPTSKLDEFIDIAKQHSVDQRAMSGFEKVGETMSEAAQQIKKQLGSAGLQKTQILQKAKNGLQEFKDAPRRAILKINKLENAPIKNEIISKLKGVKTKLDADIAIDEIQDMIYSGTRNLTLAQGSKLEKQLRRIIGELNEELKKGLPASYRALNGKYSEGIDYLNSLNRALGEKVGGVSTRGASLVKQFFSPAGTRTKELFEYIKKTTGIDLAQDASLAKFAEELFDNPNVKSLLEGIPKSSKGVLDKVIDFTIDKTGIGGKARDILREGSIKKAKDITK